MNKPTKLFEPYKLGPLTLHITGSAHPPGCS